MHIDTPVFRYVEHCLRQNQSIGGHHHQVRLQFTQPLEHSRLAQAFGLPYGYVVLLRKLFDRARPEPSSASGRPVGLGHHQQRRIARSQHLPQGFAGKLRCAGKDDFCGSSAHVCFIPVARLRRYALQTSRSRCVNRQAALLQQLLANPLPLHFRQVIDE